MGLLDRFKKKKPDRAEDKKSEIKPEVKVSDATVKAETKDSAASSGYKKAQTAKAEKTATKVKLDKKVKPSKKTEVKTDVGKKKDFKYAPGSRILLRPMISEKNAHLADTGKYVFEISPRTNKVEVKKAVLSIYGVEPAAVNIVAMQGKHKGFGRVSGQRRDWKKAIVTLPKGQTIEVYEGV